MATIKLDYAGSVTGGSVSFAGGSTTLTVTALGLKAGTPVIAQLNNAGTPTTITNVAVTADQFVVTFAVNPGACSVSYLIFNALT